MSQSFVTFTTAARLRLGDSLLHYSNCSVRTVHDRTVVQNKNPTYSLDHSSRNSFQSYSVEFSGSTSLFRFTLSRRKKRYLLRLRDVIVGNYEESDSGNARVEESTQADVQEVDFEESAIVLEDDEDEVFNEDIHSLLFPTHIVECFADAEGLLNMMSINKLLTCLDTLIFGCFLCSDVLFCSKFERPSISEVKVYCNGQWTPVSCKHFLLSIHSAEDNKSTET